VTLTAQSRDLLGPAHRRTGLVHYVHAPSWFLYVGKRLAQGLPSQSTYIFKQSHLPGLPLSVSDWVKQMLWRFASLAMGIRWSFGRSSFRQMVVRRVRQKTSAARDQAKVTPVLEDNRHSLVTTPMLWETKWLPSVCCLQLMEHHCDGIRRPLCNNRPSAIPVLYTTKPRQDLKNESFVVSTTWRSRMHWAPSQAPSVLRRNPPHRRPSSGSFV